MAMTQNLVDQLPELAIYLNEKGYLISSDALMSFFHLLPQSNIEATDVLSIEPYLKPLVVKSEQESEEFHADIISFLQKKPEISRRKETEQAKRRYDTERAQMLKRRQQLNERRQQKENALDILSHHPVSPPILDEKKKKKLDAKRKAAGAEYKKLVKTLKNKALEEQLLQLDDGAAREGLSFSKKQVNAMERALQELLPAAAFYKNFKALMAYIKEELNLIRVLKKQESVEDQREKIQNDIRSIERDIQFNQDEYDRRLAQFQQEVEQINQKVYKTQSKEHRTEWRTPHNAVYSTYDGDFEAMTKPFNKLTKQEKLMIKDYIRENTRKFRTKISSNVRTGARHRLDMAETCKKACATGGIPMRLCYEKPKPDQANLLLVLDVSGSCKEASELMLTFLYYLKDAFPGGCSTFAFVNKLYDISAYLEEDNADSSVAAVLESIPRRGVYSDYNTPLRELYHTHLSKVNRDTIIIFIGDARNNQNPSGEEYMKAIARKSRHAYWFNTEKREKWDVNDSVIGVYGRYMRMVGEVLNTAQLINFLMEVK